MLVTCIQANILEVSVHDNIQALLMLPEVGKLGIQLMDPVVHKYQCTRYLRT